MWLLMFTDKPGKFLLLLQTHYQLYTGTQQHLSTLHVNQRLGMAALTKPSALVTYALVEGKQGTYVVSLVKPITTSQLRNKNISSLP